MLYLLRVNDIGQIPRGQSFLKSTEQKFKTLIHLSQNFEGIYLMEEVILVKHSIRLDHSFTRMIHGRKQRMIHGGI